MTNEFEFDELAQTWRSYARRLPLQTVVDAATCHHESRRLAYSDTLVALAAAVSLSLLATACTPKSDNYVMASPATSDRGAVVDTVHNILLTV